MLDTPLGSQAPHGHGELPPAHPAHPAASSSSSTSSPLAPPPASPSATIPVSRTAYAYLYDTRGNIVDKQSLRIDSCPAILLVSFTVPGSDNPYTLPCIYCGINDGVAFYSHTLLPSQY